MITHRNRDKYKPFDPLRIFELATGVSPIEKCHFRERRRENVLFDILNQDSRYLHITFT